MERKGFFRLSGNAIKIFVALAMLTDHVAWYFVKTDSIIGMLMHFLGNMCAPLVCFLLTEGYVHTRNVEKYALRLAAFALISHIPFSLFLSKRIQLYPTSIFFSLLAALIAIYVYDNLRSKPLAILPILALAFITRYADWSYFVVIYAVVLFALRERPAVRTAAFAVAAAVNIAYHAFFLSWPYYRIIPMLGAFAVIPIMLLYNGSRGHITTLAKYGFYIFYPLQFLVIYLIKIIF